MRLRINESTNINPFLDKTKIPYYDRIIKTGSAGSRDNRVGKVVQMSPNEYFKECADKVFRDSLDSLIDSRDDKHSKKYTEDMINGDKFPMCYINYADRQQEGLHRMMAAGNAFGWDTEFPVLIITVEDQEVENERIAWRELGRFFYRKEYRDINDRVQEELYLETTEDTLVQDYIRCFEGEARKDGYDLTVYAVIEDDILHAFIASFMGFSTGGYIDDDVCGYSVSDFVGDQSFMYADEDTDEFDDTDYNVDIDTFLKQNNIDI